MKQNITIKQLNELSEKGKEKLGKWWKPKEGDIFVYFVGPKDEKIFGPYYYGDPTFEDSSFPKFPLLSIGQMIEFLRDNDKDLKMSYGRTPTNMGVYGIGWRVKSKGFDQTHEHLCDSLWEAVKETLEKP